MLVIRRMVQEHDFFSRISSNFSLLCINTSRPVYLVFGCCSEFPDYVIRRFDENKLIPSYFLEKKIFDAVGNLIAEPLCIIRASGSRYEIQRGVKGLPWFQLRNKIRNSSERILVERRIWATLKKLHLAIGNNLDKGISKILPCEELATVFSKYTAIEGVVADRLVRTVERATEELREASHACNSIQQHGDFCINNLIIDWGHITVIDLEDFGITSMPLYDYFTLALTLPSFDPKPSNAAQVFTHSKIVEAANELKVPESAIKWHFLHHILLRLGAWSSSRKSYRVWLEKVLDNFLNDIESNQIIR